MTSEQLRHFIFSCKYMSFTEAADRLFLHPTSISRSVSSLEKELGVELFERKHRSLALTEAGAYFMKEAEHILLIMENATSHARNIGTQTGKKLTVRMPHNTYVAVSDQFKAFLDKYPNASIDLDFYMPVDGLDICRQLDDGTIDLYFGYSDNIPSTSVSNYSIRKVGSYPVGVIVGLNHPLAANSSISLADLEGKVILNSDYHDYDVEQAVTAAMQERGLRPADHSRVLSEYELLTHVSSGHGISLFMDIPTTAFSWGCKVIPFSDFQFNKDLYMIWLSKNPSGSLRSFLDVSAIAAK